MTRRWPTLLLATLATMVALAGCHAPTDAEDGPSHEGLDADDPPGDQPGSGTEYEPVAPGPITPFNETDQSHVQVDGGRTVVMGYRSAVGDSRRLVIENQSAWEALWSEHEQHGSPAGPAPEVDFAAERVVAAFAGNKPSGCYAIRITSVTFDVGQNVTHVELNERTPQPGDICTQGFTQPFHIVASPADGTEVVFPG